MVRIAQGGVQFARTYSTARAGRQLCRRLIWCAILNRRKKACLVQWTMPQ